MDILDVDQVDQIDDGNNLSDDEFLENAVQLVPRPRTFRVRNNPFEVYNDTEFKMRYRFSKDTVLFLLENIGDNIVSSTERNIPISPMNKLLCTLRFYATGSFQKLVGDNINISPASISRIIRRVTHYIALLKRDLVKMPQDLNQVKRKFYLVSGFPGVIGTIDCTHIRIQSPGGINGERFRNRKGYFSFNVQAVCDSNLKFLHIIARWPGSVHDSTIFNDSPLKNDFEAGLYRGCFLLGDNGYPCKNYLLTPILNPQNERETRYNQSHIATRNTIERAFGVLKRRFPCLSIGLRTKLQTTIGIIVACVALHNLAIELKDELPPDDIHIQLPAGAYEEVPVEYNLGGNQTAVRTALINTRF